MELVVLVRLGSKLSFFSRKTIIFNLRSYIYCSKSEMCWPGCFVHAKNTTGMHQSERRKYDLYKKCSQCGKETSEHDKVAAHTVFYPCWNPCCGFMSLKTTCKKCNNTHNAESWPTSWFSGGMFDHNPNLGWVCWPSCMNYDAGNDHDKQEKDYKPIDK